MLTPSVANAFVTFELKSVHPHHHKIIQSNFIDLRCFDREATQFVEAENSVLK
jgi:hypothetical protein